MTTAMGVYGFPIPNNGLRAFTKKAYVRLKRYARKHSLRFLEWREHHQTQNHLREKTHIYNSVSVPVVTTNSACENTLFKQTTLYS